MPGPLFSASRASRRLLWPPEPSPPQPLSATWGAAAVHGSHRLFQRLHACRPWRPRHALPRGRSRERSTPILLGVALYRSTLRRRCLAGDPCLDAAARPSTARWHSASPRIRCGRNVTGKLQDRCVLAGEVQAIRVTAWLFASRDASKIMSCLIESAVSCGIFRVIDPRDVTN